MSVAGYLGGPGCGKSTLLRKHVYRARVDLIAFLIMDRDGRGTWDGPVFRTVDEFKRSATIPRFCVFRGPSGRDVAQLAIDVGWCCYVDEEAHRVFAEGYGPERPGRPAHPLYRIAHEGRHLENTRGEVTEVSAFLATHRPANLPADLCACMDAVYVGRTVLFTDVERCYREGWVNAGSPRDAKAQLERLQPGEFLHVPLR